MTSPQLPLPSIDTWKAGQVEFVAFPIDWQPALEQDWWQEITGSDCESTRRRNERVDTGLFHGNQLRFAANPNRLSWAVLPHIDMDNQPELQGPPTVGRFVDVLDWFVPAMAGWLQDSCPDVARIGFTATLLQFTDTREGAYELLNSYLPCVDVDPTSKEFQYRINRPRESRCGIGGLEINRLSTWSSIKMTVAYAQMSIPPRAIIAQPPAPAENFQACMLNVDINSSQDRRDPLPREFLVPLFNEITHLAVETATRGDIR